MAQQKAPYEVGDRVLLKPNKKGQVLVVLEGGGANTKHFGNGTWYGIRLTEKRGTSDGKYKGQDPAFFKCPANFGVFVQQNLIIRKLTDQDGDSFNYMDETAELEAAKAAENEKYDKSRSKLKALKAEFKKLDVDGSMSLEEKEFVPLAKKQLACNDEEASKLFKEIDVSGNGSISLAEFDGWLSSGGGITKLLQYADLKRAFRDADKDGNLSLDLAEFIKLANTAMKLEKAAATKLFAVIDANENGSICFAEFEAYVDDLGGMDNFTMYSQIIEEFKKADTDDSGGLELKEFVKLCKTKLNINKFRAGKIFNSIDTDKNGVLCVDEFEQWVAKIGGVKKIAK